MHIKRLEVGAIMANCYLVWDEETGEAVVIDPGDEGERILSVIKKEGLRVKYIINTHGHRDHIGANNMVKEATGALLAIHPDDVPLLTDTELNLSSYMGKPFQSPRPDLLLADGDDLQAGGVRLTVLDTPGHTRGGISLQTKGAVFTGDTLFKGSIGRSDFPGGSFEELIKSIKEKLMTLPDDLTVYPGHGPATTIGEEREKNPYL